ncbi:MULTISPECIES: DUF1702 family protein [Streptomyces]|uniref:DUF1702 family protein n=3 Tax=Streptomyces TaxID=1883 RepID=A0ABU2R216_9ACTN|nr:MULTISPECIES: DUF1702 family protein [unclassified Streptomyces]MDT0410732.1 DUF1702 family protein [Streptomyces sp. DSM 41979]MYQ60534.1 DUF1702 family protein [Streptomyces sp. SID4926]WEH27685.1 DUF1702 family protein [Streptomyces sp. AM 3-1-1]SCE60058.1 Protein of unknown function [Streptomyces sp. DfronAA-171]
MARTIGSLRRTLFAPPLAEVSFARRGFPPLPADSPAAGLQAVPRAVVCGFEWAIEAKGLDDLAPRLELVDVEQRGFAYEGATMACTVLDAMGRRGDRTRTLLQGPGRPHVLLAYIGIGFAMARLPRVLWKKVLPDLPGQPYHPVMSWLAVDGYGFDLAYFHTRRWVKEQRVPAAYPWQGAPEYFPRAVDQGIGRALWFIHGARPERVDAAVRAFAGHRQADLWSGVGLAAAFAGGCDADGFAALRRLAGGHRPELAQGAVFAIRARDLAGHVPAHTALAARALTDLSVPAAVALADDCAVRDEAPGPVPAYERWRGALSARLGPRTHDRT